MYVYTVYLLIMWVKDLQNNILNININQLNFYASWSYFSQLEITNPR